MASGSHITLATTARFSVFEYGDTGRIGSMQKPQKEARGGPKVRPPRNFPATQRLYMLDTYKLAEGGSSLVIA